MNREDLIRMAREAGLLVIGTADGSEAVYTWPQGITDELERFAALVAAAARAEEREACAKVCEDEAEKQFDNMDIPLTIAADLIRARKENT